MNKRWQAENRRQQQQHQQQQRQRLFQIASLDILCLLIHNTELSLIVFSGVYSVCACLIEKLKSLKNRLCTHHLNLLSSLDFARVFFLPAHIHTLFHFTSFSLVCSVLLYLSDLQSNPYTRKTRTHNGKQ